VQAVSVDRAQPRRRLRNRVFSLQGAIGAVAVVLCIVLAPVLVRQSFGPRSSAFVALVVFGGMLAVVLLWRRAGRRREVGEG
jgi:Na+/melibiose symporter-like transporter